MTQKTEINPTIRVPFETDLNTNFRIVERFRDVQKSVDARLREYELLIVDGVEGSGAESESLTKKLKFPHRSFIENLTDCRRLILLASTRRPPPVEHLAAELCKLAAQMIGHVIVVKGTQSGHFKLSQIRTRSKLKGSEWKPGIVMHVFDDFDDGLICGLLKETLLIVAAHLTVMCRKASTKKIMDYQPELKLKSLQKALLIVS